MCASNRTEKIYDKTNLVWTSWSRVIMERWTYRWTVPHAAGWLIALGEPVEHSRVRRLRVISVKWSIDAVYDERLFLVKGLLPIAVRGSEPTKQRIASAIAHPGWTCLHDKSTRRPVSSWCKYQLTWCFVLIKIQQAEAVEHYNNCTPSLRSKL